MVSFPAITSYEKYIFQGNRRADGSARPVPCIKGSFPFAEKHQRLGTWDGCEKFRLSIRQLSIRSHSQQQNKGINARIQGVKILLVKIYW